MAIIKIEIHGDGYKAYVVSEPGKWDYGTTPSMAIGELIRTHSEIFNIELIYSAEVKEQLNRRGDTKTS